MKLLLSTLIIIFLIGCSSKQPIRTTKATIIFKTPLMKFYDQGFLNYHNDYIELAIFNAGNIVLHLDIYKDQICQGTMQCLSSKEFNQKYLSESYKDTFLYDLFNQKKIYFKDKPNHILIKVKF